MDRSRLTWLIVNRCFRNRKCFTCQLRFQYRRTRRDTILFANIIEERRFQDVSPMLAGPVKTPEKLRDILSYLLQQE